MFASGLMLLGTRAVVGVGGVQGQRRCFQATDALVPSSSTPPLSSCAIYKFPSTMRTLPTIGLAAGVQTVYTYVQVPMDRPHLAGHAITLASTRLIIQLQPAAV